MAVASTQTLETIMDKEERKHEKLLLKFQAEVLDPIIKTNHLNTKFFGNPDNRDYTSLSLCSCNKHYKESDYYIQSKDTFIHFSSTKKAASIIEQGEIRLYNLSHQNDNEEYKFAANILGGNPRAYENTRRGMYSLSMCNQEIENDLTLWRLYGENTKGIAFVFRIVNNPIYWMHYHMSEIQYGEVDKLATYKRNKADFEKKNNFEFHLGLHRFLGFHKSEQYRVEQEVRLIYIHEEKEHPFSFLPKLVDTSKLPEYIPIKLNNSHYNTLPNHSDLTKPVIEIKEINLGPNFDNEELSELIKDKYPNVYLRKSNLEGIYNA